MLPALAKHLVGTPHCAHMRGRSTIVTCKAVRCLREEENRFSHWTMLCSMQGVLTRGREPCRGGLSPKHWQDSNQVGTTLLNA